MKVIDAERLRNLVKSETRSSTSEFSDGWNNALFCVLQNLESGRLDAPAAAEGLLPIQEVLRKAKGRLVADNADFHKDAEYWELIKLIDAAINARTTEA